MSILLWCMVGAAVGHSAAMEEDSFSPPFGAHMLYDFVLKDHPDLVDKRTIFAIDFDSPPLSILFNEQDRASLKEKHAKRYDVGEYRLRVMRNAPSSETVKRNWFITAMEKEDPILVMEGCQFGISPIDEIVDQDSGMTVLHKAANLPHKYPLFRVLCFYTKSNEDFSKEDVWGHSVLARTCVNGSVRSLHLVLNYLKDCSNLVNKTNSQTGETALYECAEDYEERVKLNNKIPGFAECNQREDSSRRASIALLLRYGADPAIPNKKKKTVLELAKTCPELQQILDDPHNPKWTNEFLPENYTISTPRFAQNSKQAEMTE